MSRADKLPESSVEDVLAKIRRAIIEEENAKAEATPLPEEDVFNLTDELLLTEEVAPETPSAPEAPRQVMRQEERHPSPVSMEPPRERAPAAAPDIPPAPFAFPAFEEKKARAEPSSPKQPEPASSRAQPAREPSPPRHVWSRAMSNAGQPAAAPKVATPQRSVPQATAQRSEVPKHATSFVQPPFEDIHMPVPEQGPVALFGAPDAELSESRASGHGAAAEPPSNGFSPSEFEVAAAAKYLVRSAVETMNDRELAAAQELDFQRLGERQKADMVDSFAEAMRGAGVPIAQDPAEDDLPDAFDDHFRQDVVRAVEMAALADIAQSLPANAARSGADPFLAESLSLNVAHEEPAMSKLIPLGSPQAPLAASVGRTLEDSVRDMLRPMLREWLDQNMPRIVENAIKEEIASRGLSLNALAGKER